MALDPYRFVHSNASRIIWSLARKIWTDCQAADSATWIGRGWDYKSTEHATGRALDIITSTAVGRLPTTKQLADGNTIAAWLIRHAKQLNIRHIIWNKRIYRVRYGAWGPLPGRTASSNISDWHQDHIHVLLETTTGSIPSEPVLGKPSTPVPAPPTPKPGLPPTGVSWDGVTYPGVNTFKAGRKEEAVSFLQTRLKAHSFDPGAVDGYWGPKTQAAVAAFQRSQGWSGSDADGIPGKESWARLSAAKPTPVSISLSKAVAAFRTDPARKGTPVTYDGIKLVEAALVKEKLLEERFSDGHAGTKTKEAYSRWQRKLGHSGRDADGIPGKVSLTKLGAAYGFQVAT